MSTPFAFLFNGNGTGIIDSDDSTGMNDDSMSGGGGGGGSSNSANCEMCGWLWAIGGMLAFGSFGVPVKSKVAISLDIDPLVMQSYKTGMCFITSWLFLWIRGEEITFTPMGLVSGLFWVPGGVATIYAIKTAGLAIGIGVGSSFIVLVSFSWGIFFFDEHVHSRVQACSAVACMLCGLGGMAYYSSPTVAHHHHASSTAEDGGGGGGGGDYYQPIRPDDDDFLPPDDEDDSFGRNYVEFNNVINSNNNNNSNDVVNDDDNRNNNEIEENNNSTTNDGGDGEIIPAEIFENDDNENPAIVVDGSFDGDDSNNDNDNAAEVVGVSSSSSPIPSSPVAVTLCRGYIRIQERTLGILAALFITGLWGGSMMVPMEFAPNIDKGLPFLTSFAIGATIVTICLWTIRYIYIVIFKTNNYCFREAYNALPSFHFKQMWPYGMTCGLLWSIGNFCSILSVEFLGEGVGYSSTQASMLISGLWGIFYFNEIEGSNAIFKWYLSASVTVLGILLLSYEHHEP